MTQICHIGLSFNKGPNGKMNRYFFSETNKFIEPKLYIIRVITKLPNSEQSYKGKVKTHNYINRQNQSTTG